MGLSRICIRALMQIERLCRRAWRCVEFCRSPAKLAYCCTPGMPIASRSWPQLSQNGSKVSPQCRSHATYVETTSSARPLFWPPALWVHARHEYARRENCETLSSACAGCGQAVRIRRPTSPQRARVHAFSRSHHELVQQHRHVRGVGRQSLVWSER